MLAKTWLQQARSVMDKIEETQLGNIQKAATIMADTIEAGRWVHTFGCVMLPFLLRKCTRVLVVLLGFTR